MQIKILLDSEWYLLLADRKLTERDAWLVKSSPYLAVVEPLDVVRYLDVRPKRHVKIIMAQVALAHQDGKRPILHDGYIQFVPVAPVAPDKGGKDGTD